MLQMWKRSPLNRCIDVRTHHRIWDLRAGTTTRKIMFIYLFFIYDKLTNPCGICINDRKLPSPRQNQ